MYQSIINWNCRGFRKNIDEIKMLMRDYDPIAFCCQETYMKSPSVIKFRKYSSYHIFYEAIDTRASGGVTIMIKNPSPTDKLV
jgi:exonuclease III